MYLGKRYSFYGKCTFKLSSNPHIAIMIVWEMYGQCYVWAKCMGNDNGICFTSGSTTTEEADQTA